jgi:hypothetical protein
MGSFPQDIQTEKFPDNDESGKPLMAFAELTYRGYPKRARLQRVREHLRHERAALGSVRR